MGKQREIYSTLREALSAAVVKRLTAPRRERAPLPARPVTVTGRALSAGRVTRNTYKVGKGKNQERPLPFHLQCHPVRLAPTPLNPQCYTNLPQYGMAQTIVKQARTRAAMLAGITLRKGRTRKFRYQIFIDDVFVGSHTDLHHALAWTIAARDYDLKARLVDTSPLT